MKTVILNLTEDRLKAFGDAIKAKTKADSLDMIELLMEAENIFGVKIPDCGDFAWMEE